MYRNIGVIYLENNMDTFIKICLAFILGGMSLTMLAVSSWAVVTVIDYCKFIKRKNDKIKEKD